MNTYLAVDFGGGSGRVMAGSICQGTGIFWLCLMR